MKDQTLPKGAVPAVIKAVSILDAIADAGEPLSLAQLTRLLDQPKSSLLALCNTLVHVGFVKRLDNGAYQLDTHLVDLAHAYLSNIDVTREFSTAWDSLGVHSGEGGVLAVLDKTDVVYVACRTSDLPLGVNYRIGMRLPAHCAATGKALLSTLPDERIRALYGNTPLTQLTRHSIGTVDALLEDLHQTRLRRYAIDDEETREGMRCYGAPVFDSPGSHAIAAVAVSTLKHPSDNSRDMTLVDTLLRLANELSSRLGAHGRLI
ncbi:MAG: IclR family transcriptional regulator [Aquisalimonadaceae bacterium]